MDPQLTFVFYLIGTVCLLAAAFERGRVRSFDLMALGLAAYSVPTLWNTAEAAF